MVQGWRFAGLVAFAAGSAWGQCYSWVSCQPNAPLIGFGTWDPDGPGPLAPRAVATGGFSRVGGIVARHVAVQDPVTRAWSDVGGGVWDTAQPSGRIVMGLPNGELLVGGRFNMAGQNTVALKIARFDGSLWRPLGDGLMLGDTDQAFPMAAAVLPNGDLAVGGNFTRSGAVGLSNIGRWDGAAWHAMGEGLDRPVTALVVLPDGRLCAGGQFLNAGSTPASRIAVWDGQAWAPLGSGLSDTVSSLCMYQGRLTVGGSFRAAGGESVGGLAQWDGDRWTALTEGVPQFRIVRALAVLPSGELVAGGDFQTIGGVDTGCVARYDGVAWAALDEPMRGDVMSFAVLPGDRLGVGGSLVNLRSGESGGFIREPAVAPYPADPTPWRAILCTSRTTYLGSNMRGGRPMTFQWRRNGVPLVDVPGSLSGVNAEQLAFIAPTPDLEGVYDCVVTNGCGTGVSSAAEVRVCAADFDCNGFVDFFDYHQFVGYFELGVGEADTNADGIIDFFDYLEFVEAFEAGC